VTFYFKLYNVTENGYALSNSFRIYSPDGAEWTQTFGQLTTALDTIPPLHLLPPAHYNQLVGTGGIPGDGRISNEVRFTSWALPDEPGDGFPPFTNLVGYQIEIGPIDPQYSGKTICVDSITTPPSSFWKWYVSGDLGDDEYPYWGGPFCFTIGDGCCMGELTGNVDYDPTDFVDLGDLTHLIYYLFHGLGAPVCMAEANIDGDPEGLVDLADLTALIDYLFISFTPPAPCQ
jgi:hypothetical protein